jgi:hypothetical protein
MAVCDGCGLQVDDAHIRRRIERLELATRFRPIHIQVLLIDIAPPIRVEDCFYRAASNRDERSLESRNYFDEIVKCASFTAGPEITEEAALAEFQHRGFYLAHAVECPVEAADSLADALERVRQVVIKRIQKSYKPKYIAPISDYFTKLIPLFEQNGWGDKLLLNHGGPLQAPLMASAGAAATPSPVSLADQLAAALARLP